MWLSLDVTVIIRYFCKTTENQVLLCEFYCFLLDKDELSAITQEKKKEKKKWHWETTIHVIYLFAVRGSFLWTHAFLLLYKECFFFWSCPFIRDEIVWATKIKDKTDKNCTWRQTISGTVAVVLFLPLTQWITMLDKHCSLAPAGLMHDIILHRRR